MGCHSDSGFAHTERNFYSQMIFDASFEDDAHISSQSGWTPVVPDTATATITADTGSPLNGLASRKIAYTAGSGAGRSSGAQRECNKP